jgi:DNA-binding response OmpR family regulator
VDDEEDLVALIKVRLESKGFAVCFAYDGLRGLALVKKEKPDLVILDLMMPKMDGRDVLIRIRKDKVMKNIPVIILTCKKEQFERNYGFELGADAYIEKPYDADFLLREVNHLLKRDQ